MSFSLPRKSLSEELERFTGYLTTYRHTANLRITEGVKYFAQHAKAIWFLDGLSSPKIIGIDDYISVSFISKNQKASIVARGCEGQVLYEEVNIPTDCIDMHERFYLHSNEFGGKTLMLPAEY